MSELDVLVVGGGISGLAIAHCLARAGSRVEVWESAPRVGGKISTTVREGYRLESAASMVVNFRTELDGFLRSAGLQSSVCARAPHARRYLADAERLHEVPAGPGELLRSTLFSRRAKLRLLAEPLVPRAAAPGESVAAFVTRRLGREFLDNAFEPYVAGPLASDVDQAEARATLPKLSALEARYGSLTLGALLGRVRRGGRAMSPLAFSFRGGMATLVEALGQAGGFGVRNALRVTAIRPVPGGWLTSATGNGQSRTAFARQLVLSTPADATAALVADLHPGLARELRAIEYAPVSVVHTGFARQALAHPLHGSGFLVTRRSGLAANGCLWMSSLFPDRAPEGEVLLSSYLGGARNRAAADWDAARSEAAVLQMLRALLGARATPHLVHIQRHERALPLYHGAYTRRLLAIERCLGELPGLHLEANYRGGVSVRDRILRAAQVSARIMQRAARPAPRASARLVPGVIPATAAATAR